MSSTIDILEQYTSYKENSIQDRYINYTDIKPLLKKWSVTFNIKELGVSENNLPIELLTLGTGSKKLLLWSQMHGNESTTTRAVFDLLNFLADPLNTIAQNILKECTLYIVPMLNPDGSTLYTRANFNEVDLNRDAQDLSQAESIIFKKLVDEVDPLVAFNLHGQRTIFSAGQTNKSAIVSFLSPSSNAERTVTESRKIGMRIISEMNTALQQHIPNCVGRYDDGFNINCTGDTLENNNITTILFEAGHHPNDFKREVTRKWMYLSLVTSLNFIASNVLNSEGYDAYFDIPENGKCFKDIIIRNYNYKNNKVDISIQYKEQLQENEVVFLPYIADIQSNISEYGHYEANAAEDTITILTTTEKLKIDNKIVSIQVNDKEFSVFPIIY